MASYKEDYSSDFLKEDRDNSNSTNSGDNAEQKSGTDLASDGNQNKNCNERSNEIGASADDESFNNEGKLIVQFYKEVIDVILKLKHIEKRNVNELTANMSGLVSTGDFGTVKNDYSKSIHRTGYLSMYGACRTGLVKKAIWSFLQNKKCTICSTNQLKVVSLEGGPGCDLVGFCSALQETRNDVRKIDCKIIDSKDWESEFKTMVKVAKHSDFGSFSELLNEIKFSSTFVDVELNTEGIFQGKSLSSVIGEADFVLKVELEDMESNYRDKQLIKNVVDTMKVGSKCIFIYKLGNDLFDNISSLFTIYDGYQEYKMPDISNSEWRPVSTLSDKAHIRVFEKK